MVLSAALETARRELHSHQAAVLASRRRAIDARDPLVDRLGAPEQIHELPHELGIDRSVFSRQLIALCLDLPDYLLPPSAQLLGYHRDARI
jgi:hypothetical protein